MPIPAMTVTAVMKRTTLQMIDIDYSSLIDGIIILHFRMLVYWQNTQICERFFVEFVFIANEDRDAHSRSCELRGCIGDGLAFPRAPSRRRSRQCSDFFSDKNKPGGGMFREKIFFDFYFFVWLVQTLTKTFFNSDNGKTFFNLDSGKIFLIQITKLFSIFN